MSLINVSSLDFSDIRTSIKDQIRTNPNFTDYDFEGSTLSFLIDILAYNTYISSFNANLISNEVFIDSATIRENVVALARNIGYIPRPRKSASAVISFFIDTTEFPTPPKTVTLRKGSVATSRAAFASQSFSFSITEDITVPVVRNQANFDDIKIYEGSYVEENFTFSSTNVNQRFILSNPGIDYNTLVVRVREDQFSSNSILYSRSDSLFEIDGTSTVYFIQEVEDERYELIFGDNIFGKQLSDGSFIEVSYVVSNGESGNGVSNFSFSGTLLDNNGSLIARDISQIFTSEQSNGGSSIESIKSIKKYAPRIYSSQNRAVNSNDYEAIVKNIYPEAEYIAAFGGEELDPPRFGRVLITIKPTNGLFLSTGTKQNLIRELKKYSVAGIVPEILDAKTLFITFNSRIFYNSSFSSSLNDLKTKITDTITKFAESKEINSYRARFKYSKFLSLIDNSDSAVSSNATEVNIKRVLQPVINRFAEYEICFKNRFLISSDSGNIRTSGFKVAGIQDTVYISDVVNSGNKTGVLNLCTFKNNTLRVIKPNIGTVDYEEGEILVSALNIVSTELNASVPIIEFVSTPALKDVYSVNELLLELDIPGSTIDLVDESLSQSLQNFPRNLIV
jgi:hypothetical protein